MYVVGCVIVCYQGPNCSVGVQTCICNVGMWGGEGVRLETGCSGAPVIRLTIG